LMQHRATSRSICRSIPSLAFLKAIPASIAVIRILTLSSTRAWMVSS
jgi:hypothetical protein